MNANQKKAPRTYMQKYWIGLALVILVCATILAGNSEIRYFCLSRTSASYFCAYAGIQPAHKINQTNQTNIEAHYTTTINQTNIKIAQMQQYINLHNMTSQNISIAVAPYIVKLKLTRSNPITTGTVLYYKIISSGGKSNGSISYANCTITNATIIAPDGSSGIVNQTYAYSLLKINGYISSSGECSYSGG